ncbi:thioredoxin reductase (NADPH) [Nematocida minor]|uniref:thioredoxin reductase (NADPH) n=1 Tax=Nematocida minor TaxID=1912983 RepID=UPI0022208B4B|nr:thioredoxin reductase (NADPH) [Nematocida minor]KAI5191610.1 thioredoxin reductase (NADPH) [Nematocida minor]
MSISMNVESVIIVGSGPAAYSAAIYCKKYKPLILAGDYSSSTQYPGGQLTTTTAVDNYPGFPEGIQGPELVSMFEEHATAHARKENLWVSSITKDEDHFILRTIEGNFITKAVIVATGSVANKLIVPGVDKLWQRGISACATCDGWLFSEQIVMVVGGGDTAMEEVQYLSNIAKKVILVHRSDKFRARPDLLNKIREIENVEIIEWAVLVEAKGETKLSSVIIQNTQSKETQEIPVEGLFFAIGHTPSTGFLKTLQEETKTAILASDGYIKANKKTMETEIKGLYAAGDVQDNRYRQAITAAYSGMLAGESVASWLDTQNQ